MADLDPFDKHRIEVRQLWRRLTPFRLGMIVGASDDNLPNPYTTPTARACFDAGISVGREQKAKLEEGARVQG